MNDAIYLDDLDEDASSVVRSESHKHRSGESRKSKKSSKTHKTLNSIIDDSDKNNIYQLPDSPLEIRLGDIGDTNDLQHESGLDLMDVCRGLKIDYRGMHEFIEGSDDNKLNRSILKLFDRDDKRVDNLTSKEKADEYAKICALSLFKRLKFMENKCSQYQQRSDDFNAKVRLYRNPRVKRSLLSGSTNTNTNTNTNTKMVDVNLAEECNSILEEMCDPNYEMTREADMKMSRVANSIMTPHCKKHEIIKYKLLFYNPLKQIRVSRSNLADVSHRLKAELDSVTAILNAYMEDKVWKINIGRKINFKVPESKLVFSNTVNADDIDNNYLTTHLNMIIRYLERITDAKSVKYYVVEDNKYDIHWVLIAVSVRDSR
jgi:hypothetical protein